MITRLSSAVRILESDSVSEWKELDELHWKVASRASLPSNGKYICRTRNQDASHVWFQVISHNKSGNFTLHTVLEQTDFNSIDEAKVYADNDWKI